MTSAEELTIRLDHLQVAAKVWGPPQGLPVLALHGWLDNAASFDRLAPLLPELRLVAIDLPGHGHSGHRPAGTRLHFLDWVPEVVAVADHLGWQRFALLGHSLGGGIAPVVAAVIPERLSHLVLLDAVGPLSAAAADAPENLRKALRCVPHRISHWPDLDSAVAARVNGNDLNPVVARPMVARATRQTAAGITFRHDPRLRERSLLYLSEEQVLAFLGAVSCPVLVIRARQGWPLPEQLVAGRLAAVNNLQYVAVEGGHHVHLTDPETVLPHLWSFLVTPDPPPTTG